MKNHRAGQKCPVFLCFLLAEARTCNYELASGKPEDNPGVFEMNPDVWEAFTDKAEMFTGDAEENPW
jgi:hypothetical protein